MMYPERTSGWSKVSKLGRSFNHTGCSRGPPRESQELRRPISKFGSFPMSASSHRIILLNFTEAEANAVAKAGYKVDRGIIGSPDREGKYCPFQVPHPLYEYDVLVLFYNSQLSRSPELQSQL